MARQLTLVSWYLKIMIVVALVLVLVLLASERQTDFLRIFTRVSDLSSSRITPSKKPAGTCSAKKSCPEDQFNFYMRTGAANVVGPVVCVQNNLVLGTILNNAGVGINILELNGKTGDVLKSDHFDMYSGEVKPLTEFLNNIQETSVVLIATFDEPASKLNDETRTLISELGSSYVKQLGFRDNWLFVGRKGTEAKSNFEKYIKNDQAVNKYENWPEVIELEGCIPKLPE